MFLKYHNPGRSMQVFEANLKPSKQMTILKGCLHHHISGQTQLQSPIGQSAHIDIHLRSYSCNIK